MAGRSQCRIPPLVPKAAAPWLVFAYGKGMKNQAFYNILNPDNKSCRKSILELSGKSLWQKSFHQNWVIILCEDSISNSDNWKLGKCFLWNSVSSETIELPNLVDWITRPKKFGLIDCVLTSPPDVIDSVVVFLFSTWIDKRVDILLLFLHPGEKQWRTRRICTGDSTGVRDTRDLFALHSFRGVLPKFGEGLVSLLSLRGKLYVTFQRDDRLLEIKREYLFDNDGVKTIRPLELFPGTSKLLPLGAELTELYYVESEYEIFKIWVSYNPRCKQVMSIYLWRLDFSSMKWEEMNDLNDHVIFIGPNTRFHCSAAELGLESGALYYTLDGDQSLYKFEIQGGNAVILPCLHLHSPWCRPQWIMIMPVDGVEEEEKPQKCFSLKEIEHKDEEMMQQTSPWVTLCEDTLAVISTYLHPLDYVHFRSVCRENRRVLPPTTRNRGSSSTGCPCISPWLMFFADNNYNFVDPVHQNEAYLMSFCESVQGATIRYQKDGWLLMSRERNIFFYNPFTREIIKLPDLPDGCWISVICVESSPVSPGCTVLAIDQTPLNTGILMIMRGDIDWTTRPFPCTDVEKKLKPLHGTAPIFYKNGFYCVDCDGTLGALHLIKDGRWSVLAKPQKIFNNDMHPKLLVVCGGDLLLIKLGHLGTAVRIYRLDSSEMEWVKVESLGKHMLFISETSCMSAVALNTQMENIIYFPRTYLNGGGILSYSLATGSYHSSFAENCQDSLKNSFHDTKGWLSNCTWIQPNWCKATEQELDWLNPLG